MTMDHLPELEQDQPEQTAVAFHADEEEFHSPSGRTTCSSTRSPPGEPWTQITHENLQRAQQQDESLKPLQQEAQQDEDSQYRDCCMLMTHQTWGKMFP